MPGPGSATLESTGAPPIGAETFGPKLDIGGNADLTGAAGLAEKLQVSTGSPDATHTAIGDLAGGKLAAPEPPASPNGPGTENGNAAMEPPSSNGAEKAAVDPMAEHRARVAASGRQNGKEEPDGIHDLTSDHDEPTKMYGQWTEEHLLGVQRKEGIPKEAASDLEFMQKWEARRAEETQKVRADARQAADRAAEMAAHARTEPRDGPGAGTQHSEKLKAVADAAERDRQLQGLNRVDLGDPENIAGQQRAQEGQRAASEAAAQQAAKEARRAEAQREADAAKKAEDAEIVKLYDEKRPMTAEQLTRYEQIQAEKATKTDTETALDEIRSRPQPWSEEDKQKYQELSAQLAQERFDAMSPEDQLKARAEELQGLYGRAFEKMHNGEDFGPELAAYNAKLAEALDFQVKEGSAQLARDFAKGFINPDTLKSPVESARMREVRERLQELAGLEMQLRAQREIVQRMQQQEKQMKNDMNVAEKDYVNANDPAEKQQKLQVFSAKTLRLTAYQDALREQRRLGRTIIADRRRVRGYLHRKLGTRNVFSNMAFGAGTAFVQGFNAIDNTAESIFDAVS